MHVEDYPVADQPHTDAIYREVKFRHSRDFATLIDTLGVSLLISTYQAGKLVVVGTCDAALTISLHNFEQAMGIAVHPSRLAVGSRGVIWFLQNAAEFASRLEPVGRYDACYLTRQSLITGNIHAHEIAWAGDELWVVNTLFSCLCTLHEDYSFVPRWQPPFISELAGNDRCHLNGMALDAGQPKYATVMAASNEPGGWRPTKATSGCILDIASGLPLSEGLAMPHSPRVYGGQLWVLNSGCGSLELVDSASGKRVVVAQLPGYTRGLAFFDGYAFVGMSRIRETAVFGGVPIAERRDELRCAVAVIDLRNGESVAFLEFETGVEEIFDVQVLPGARSVSLTGPFPVQDDAQDIWVVPPPGSVPKSPTGKAGSGTAASKPPCARQLSDDDVTSLVSSGLRLQQHGRFAEAVQSLEQASAARPRSAELSNHLGNALQDFGRQDLAIECYQRAIAIDGSFSPAAQNLGYLLVNVGRLDEGIAHIEHAQAIQPSAVNRVMLATSLPVVYESTADLARRRESLEANVRALVADRVTIDATRTALPTNFFAAYQGFNDREIQVGLASIYRAPDLTQKGPLVRRGDRIRVGFLSAHFRDHTIGRLNLGRTTMLNRTEFEVTVISAGRLRDEVSEEFERRCDRFVQLSGSLEEARRQVADLELDVLLFADVGMDAFTYSLALSRMAGVQCATWGHPVTTGNPSMDYFISSHLLETDAADADYSERLIRLSNLGTYYYRPRPPAARRTRTSFGLDDCRHIYFCPQTLFKLHPEFDAILAGILRRDQLGDVVLIEGRQPHWTALVKERFTRTLGDVAHRVRFLAPQSNPDFLELNCLADVLLDTIHFGGGNTSYEGLAAGTPIVTLPGRYLRSRITLALYRKMQVMDCVVGTPEEYIELAVRLGSDADQRSAISAKIHAASGVLFEDAAEVRELERFLTWAVEVPQRASSFGPND